MVDVIMSAVCPGKDECSVAIYLTGAQNVVCMKINNKKMWYNRTSGYHAVYFKFIFHKHDYALRYR